MDSITFTAHITHTSITDLQAMPVSQIRTWYQSAVKLHNFLNTVPENE